MCQNNKFTNFKRISWYLKSLIALIPFMLIIFIAAMNSNLITTIDQWIAKPILASRSTTLTPFYLFITNLGGALYLFLGVLLCSLFLIWKDKDYYAALWLSFQSLLGALLLNQLLKAIFARSRPLIETLAEQGGYSFPSGHSMGSMICLGGIIFLLVKKLPQKIARIGLITSIALLILFIGISRIYIGVHYPTDVIGGFSVGVAWLICSTEFYPIGRKRFNHYLKKDGD